MNFGQALEALKAGKRVRLNTWDVSWLVVIDGSIEIRNAIDRNVESYPMCGPGFLSDDWVIVEDKKGMTFGEALAALKEGKKVTRPFWLQHGAHLRLEGDVINFYSNGKDYDGLKFLYKERWTPNLSCFEANDWQVVT